MLAEDTKQLIEAMNRKMDEHELLVRIDERGKVYERDIRLLFDKISEEKVARETDIVLIRAEIKGILRIRDMLSGAVGLIGFAGVVLGVVLSWAKLTGHGG